MKKIIVTLYILVASTIANATPMYQVEVVAFVPKQLTSSERWLSSNALPRTDQAMMLQKSANTANQPFTELPASAKHLHGAVKRLQDQYHVLSHTAWLQPHTPVAQTVQLHGNLRDIALHGTLQLRIQHYITATTNLGVSIPSNELPRGTQVAGLSDGQTANFVMHQTRRLRLNELHYIDDPMVGLLIKVTKTSEK